MVRTSRCPRLPRRVCRSIDIARIYEGRARNTRPKRSAALFLPNLPATPCATDRSTEARHARPHRPIHRRQLTPAPRAFLPGLDGAGPARRSHFGGLPVPSRSRGLALRPGERTDAVPAPYRSGGGPGDGPACPGGFAGDRMPPGLFDPQANHTGRSGRPSCAIFRRMQRASRPGTPAPLGRSGDVYETPSRGLRIGATTCPDAIRDGSTATRASNFLSFPASR